MVGLDGTLQSGRLDQPRSSFNGAPIMIIHTDGADDADGDDGGEGAKSKYKYAYARSMSMV